MFIRKDIIPVICICISEILEIYVLVSIAMFSLEYFIIYLHTVVELIILIYIEFLYSNHGPVIMYVAIKFENIISGIKFNNE